MKLRSMKLHTLFQVMLLLCGVLAFAGNTSAQQPPAAGPVSVAKTVATVQLSPKEFADRKEHLLKTKQVNQWAPKGTIKGQPGQFLVELTVSECTWLGGTIVYWSSCGGTLMKCVGSSGRERCIDEVK